MNCPPLPSQSRLQLITAIVALLATCCIETSSTTRADEPAKKKVATAPKSPRANRLADETSPYLLLHAHNPVDWYPWGEEALAKAKQEGKPIFLSVGYSSCHWCHVMERESFMDEEIAAFLNEHFVCIKVDREERPDVDSIYMTSLHVYNQLTRSGRGGGWPMSMFLTPETQPFFGGTYFPARDGDRGAITGFFTLLKRVQQLWQESPEKIREDAATITQFVKQQLDARRPVALADVEASVLDECLESLKDQYDADFGGFGYSQTNPQRPKFPEPSNLVFLLDQLQSDRLQDKQTKLATDLLTGTLQRMAMGGIRDHLGGGFHRYSVDRFWRIPHFEKMLYDNGQLATVYAEAYALTGRDDFKRVVDEMLDFVVREMTDEGGAFYSALDAESEGEEGKFYRWERDEVQEALADGEYELFAAVYGLEDEPNFEEHYYAPQLTEPLNETAKSRDVTEQTLDGQLAPIRAKLLAVRDKRKRPLTDTKILTSWNGMMIRGFADAGRVLENPEYIDAAARAANFVLDNLRTEDGRLLRTHSQGESKLNAYLDDYAFFVDGLLGLHRATGDDHWLQAADELTTKQIELHWDERHGGFYFTSEDHEALLARGRNPVDGARPSGNSVSACNLLYLAKKGDDEARSKAYLGRAEKTIRSVSGLVTTSPTAAPRLLTAVRQWLEIRAAK